MSSLASSSGESEYGYSLTVSDEERLCAIADRLSPPKPPRPTSTTAPKLPRASKTAPPPNLSQSTPSKSSRSHSHIHTQTFETVSTLPNSQFRNPGPDFDDHVDHDLSAALSQFTEDDLSFEISELDTPERPKPPKPPKPTFQDVASTSSQKTGSVVGRNISGFSPDHQRDDVSVASRSSKARSKVKQAYSDICYPDLSRALLEAQAELFAGIEDQTASEIEPQACTSVNNKQDNRPPIERFRNTEKKVLAVTDLTAGSWCELQHFYVITRRRGRRKRTEAMIEGSKIHDKLEREIFTPVAIRTSKREEEMGLRVWHMIQGLRTLRDTGLTRELQTWGMVDGNVVSGIIDSVSYENPDPELEDDVVSSRGGSQTSSQRLADLLPPGSQERKTEIFITDVKTRRTPNPPSKPQVHASIIQLFLYHRFLSEMASDKLDYLHVFERYDLNPDEPFSHDFMAQINDIADIPPMTTTDNSPISKTNNHHFNETMYPSDSDSDSNSNFESAISSPSRLNPDASNTAYSTLRSLIPLLKFELQLTFPHGASDLGKIVAVEYRYRGTNPIFDEDSTESSVEPDEEDPETGRVICVNSFFVEPATLDLYLEETMGWWKGDREPRGVSLEEAFKCRFCEFAPECDWRARMEMEFVRKMRTKRKSGVGSSLRKAEEVDEVKEEKTDGEEEKVDKRRKPRGGKKGKKEENQGMAGSGDAGNERILW
ncbi:exonuclease V [Cladorrhinum sp. PSN332]|nr:exonuclease V [Cladorrhinum sp. PSN332]